MGGYVRTKHVGRNGREAARGSRRPCRIPEVSRGWLPRHFSLGMTFCPPNLGDFRPFGEQWNHRSLSEPATTGTFPDPIISKRHVSTPSAVVLVVEHAVLCNVTLYIRLRIY